MPIDLRNVGMGFLAGAMAVLTVHQLVVYALSATGIITIMADMFGFDAYGIEIDAALVATAHEVARRHRSGARFG